jgi:hypothetical protein
LAINKFTNLRASKIIIPILGFIISLTTILYLVFYHYPYFGHDYSLVISWANDYNFAWKNFGVFNLIFTPQRCGGVPVWANPIGSNFSLFHLLSIFLSDLNVIIVFITIITGISYYGLTKLLSLFKIDTVWKEYFCISWCLQGFIASRLIVGHLPLMNVSMWPLYSYLILKSSQSKFKTWAEVCILSILLAHDFYLGNVYLFVMFPLAFLILLLTLNLHRFQINNRLVLKKLFFLVILSSIFIAPKVLAVLEFTKNFQRNVSFVPIEFSNSLNYIFMNYLLPLKLEYNQMTGWWYGNWEALNYLFPGFFVVVLIRTIIRYKEEYLTVVSLLIVLLIATFIAGGSYYEIVRKLPFIKSFHVNPRWLPILNLSILAIFILHIKNSPLPKWTSVLFMIISISLPFYFLDRNYLKINYTYRQGLDVISNRVDYCYEPVFGYRLELLPIRKINGKYADPRCYLGNVKCHDFNLPIDMYQELESYELKPFKN